VGPTEDAFGLLTQPIGVLLESRMLLQFVLSMKSLGEVGPSPVCGFGRLSA